MLRLCFRRLSSVLWQCRRHPQLPQSGTHSCQRHLLHSFVLPRSLAVGCKGWHSQSWHGTRWPLDAAKHTNRRYYRLASDPATLVDSIVARGTIELAIIIADIVVVSPIIIDYIQQGRVVPLDTILSSDISFTAISMLVFIIDFAVPNTLYLSSDQLKKS